MKYRNQMIKLLDMVLPSAIMHWVRMLRLEIRVQFARFYHFRAIRRIRRKIKRGDKIRVLFLDSETAKWKVQPLFELMNHDSRYEPFVGIYRRDVDEHCDALSVKNGMNNARIFFERLGNRWVYVYDPNNGCPIDLRKFSPDIVFYQQPWNVAICHSPAVTSKFALTCYIPYYVPSYGIPKLEAHKVFHRFLALYFTLNEAWTAEYKRDVHPLFFSGEMHGLGNPVLDVLAHGPYLNEKGDTKQIIYAPHFSIAKESENFKPEVPMSTFLENGREILSYAIEHPQFRWIFKPHPMLKAALVDSTAWTPAEVMAYYSEWAKIGMVCDEGDYMRLFACTSLLITDCGSFLSEFGATGQPIIRLISKRNVLNPCEPSRKLFSTFYEVKSLPELYSCLDMILMNGIDPKMKIRQDALHNANLNNGNASQCIMDFFSELFKI